MTERELSKLTKQHGAILALTEAEKKMAVQNGYVVQEIQTPCGADGFQAVHKPKKK